MMNRKLLAPALVLLTAIAAAEEKTEPPPPKPPVPSERASARATMQTFIERLNAYQKTPARSDLIEDAIACLDLS